MTSSTSHNNDVESEEDKKKNIDIIFAIFIILITTYGLVIISPHLDMIKGTGNLPFDIIPALATILICIAAIGVGIKKFDLTGAIKTNMDNTKKSNFGSFFLFTVISFVLIYINGLLDANMLFFSRLSKTIDTQEDTLHTYFPIGSGGWLDFIPRPSESDDFGEYFYGSTPVETKYGGQLKNICIPPTGFKDNIFSRFPYNLMDFDPDSIEGGGFYAFIKKYVYYRLSWFGRTVACFYIILRKCIHKYFHALKYLIDSKNPTIKFVAIILLILLSPLKIYMLSFLLQQTLIMPLILLCSAIQIKWNEITLMTFPLTFIASLFDLIVLLITTPGIMTGLFIQYFFTFILPFNLIYNIKSLNIYIKELKPVISVFFLVCVFAFSISYLNPNISMGVAMLLIPIAIYNLIQSLVILPKIFFLNA
tara:strand:+ start:2963 stop:4225 length:1263 start_codon:yes stop_codon:yes gene_type:complete